MTAGLMSCRWDGAFEGGFTAQAKAIGQCQGCVPCLADLTQLCTTNMCGDAIVEQATHTHFVVTGCQAQPMITLWSP